ncbi:alpha-1A adrenergic receptor-like [Strongylocentrotus purpuratus]|uniref:G-protein coupled receptors family 1 profile domain-containing protein n=1 Tax=Strongylocentrotus purpuratus TaxID=7668 RepID=A0A7M7T335_STRPU|nr:alpha-1A adrenergic receptor-like [Strongylocentrotus purpuratus]
MVLPKLSDINEVSKIFHLALSLMDLVVGIVTLITVVFDVVDGMEFVRPLCITTGILNIVAPTSSVCILVLLHVDRFLSITKPLRYPAWITPRKAQVQILIACVSLTGIVVIGIGVSPSSWDIIYSPGTIAVCMADFTNIDFAPYFAAIMLLGVWLPAGIIFVMYCRIICISLKASGQIRRAKVAPVAAAMAPEGHPRCAQHAHPVNNALEPGGSTIQIIFSLLRMTEGEPEVAS